MSFFFCRRGVPMGCQGHQQDGLLQIREVSAYFTVAQDGERSQFSTFHGATMLTGFYTTLFVMSLLVITPPSQSMFHLDRVHWAQQVSGYLCCGGYTCTQESCSPLLSMAAQTCCACSSALNASHSVTLPRVIVST